MIPGKRAVRKMIGMAVRRYLCSLYGNRRIVRVYGMKRSGNHACINWLINAFEGRTVTPLTDERVGFCHYSPSGKIVHLNVVNMTKMVRYVRSVRSVSARIAQAEVLIISSEEVFSDQVDYRHPSKGEVVYVTRSILNLVASRIQGMIRYAEMGIGHKGFSIDDIFFRKLLSWQMCSSKTLVWSYDQWISDPGYRKSFLNRMGLEYDAIPSISFQGGGSSFTGMTGTPHSADVLSRYCEIDIPDRIRALLCIPQYNNLLSESERNYLLQGTPDERRV